VICSKHLIVLYIYKVVQIWPGQTVTCLHTNRPGHIWTTLYIPETPITIKNMFLPRQRDFQCILLSSCRYNFQDCSHIWHLFHMHLAVHTHWCLKYNLFYEIYCVMFGQYNLFYKQQCFERIKLLSVNMLRQFLSPVLQSDKLKWLYICLFRLFMDIKCLYHNRYLIMNKTLCL
jgi:hypothetical protein